jgi:hypothetical protein
MDEVMDMLTTAANQGHSVAQSTPLGGMYLK